MRNNSTRPRAPYELPPGWGLRLWSMWTMALVGLLVLCRALPLDAQQRRVTEEPPAATEALINPSQCRILVPANGSTHTAGDVIYFPRIWSRDPIVGVETLRINGEPAPVGTDKDIIHRRNEVPFGQDLILVGPSVQSFNGSTRLEVTVRTSAGLCSATTEFTVEHPSAPDPRAGTFPTVLTQPSKPAPADLKSSPGPQPSGNCIYPWIHIVIPYFDEVTDGVSSALGKSAIYDNGVEHEVEDIFTMEAVKAHVTKPPVSPFHMFHTADSPIYDNLGPAKDAGGSPWWPQNGIRPLWQAEDGQYKLFGTAVSQSTQYLAATHLDTYLNKWYNTNSGDLTVVLIDSFVSPDGSSALDANGANMAGTYYEDFNAILLEMMDVGISTFPGFSVSSYTFKEVPTLGYFLAHEMGHSMGLDDLYKGPDASSWDGNLMGSGLSIMLTTSQACRIRAFCHGGGVGMAPDTAFTAKGCGNVYVGSDGQGQMEGCELRFGLVTATDSMGVSSLQGRAFQYHCDKDDPGEGWGITGWPPDVGWGDGDSNPKEAGTTFLPTPYWCYGPDHPHPVTGKVCVTDKFCGNGVFEPFAEACEVDENCKNYPEFTKVFEWTDGCTGQRKKKACLFGACFPPGDNPTQPHCGCHPDYDKLDQCKADAMKEMAASAHCAGGDERDKKIQCAENTQFGLGFNPVTGGHTSGKHECNAGTKCIDDCQDQFTSNIYCWKNQGPNKDTCFCYSKPPPNSGGPGDVIGPGGTDSGTDGAGETGKGGSGTTH